MQIFVTGTDTGVGKTIVTALCLAHLRQRGVRALALKPFCSGERSDALLLWELQERVVSLEEINPFYFPVPISPWTAARQSGIAITRDQTLARIRKHSGHEVLIIEGAGGLLAPLGVDFNAADLIEELGCDVLVVAANRIGTLNHTLLTLEALRARGIGRVRLALSDDRAGDDSAKTNESDLRLLLPGLPLARIPFLPGASADPNFFRSVAPSLSGVITALVSCESEPKL